MQTPITAFCNLVPHNYTDFLKTLLLLVLPPERIPSDRNIVTSDFILPEKSHNEEVEMSLARCSDVDALRVKYSATSPYTIIYFYNLRNSLCNVKKIGQSAKSCLVTSRVDQ